MEVPAWKLPHAGPGMANMIRKKYRHTYTYMVLKYKCLLIMQGRAVDLIGGHSDMVDMSLRDRNRPTHYFSTFTLRSSLIDRSFLSLA